MTAMADLEGGELVLVEPRRGQYALLAIDSVFVVAGVFLAVTGEVASGLATTIFFGVALGLACRGVAIPARLAVRGNGFQDLSRRSPGPVFEWSRCSRFHPWSPAAGATFVSFEYAGPKPIYRGRLARLNRSLTGGNCALPSTYGMKAIELCRLLEQRRAQASE